MGARGTEVGMQHSQGIYFRRNAFSKREASFLNLFLRVTLKKSLDIDIYIYFVQGRSYIRYLLTTQGKAYPIMKTVHKNCHLNFYHLFLLVKRLKFFLLVYLFSKLPLLRLKGGLSRKEVTQHAQGPRVHSQYQGQRVLSGYIKLE